MDRQHVLEENWPQDESFTTKEVRLQSLISNQNIREESIYKDNNMNSQDPDCVQ